MHTLYCYYCYYDGDRMKCEGFVGMERRNAGFGAIPTPLTYYANGNPERLPQVMPSVLTWR